MATTVIEKEVYGSSLAFWEGDPSKESSMGASYTVDPSSVSLFMNKTPDGNPGPPKMVTRVSVEPLWASGYTDPFEDGGKFFYFKNVYVQPFIKSNRANPEYFLFSGSDEVEWKLNQWGPTTNLAVVNDIHYDDRFVVQPLEELKIRMYGSYIASGTVTSATNTAMWAAWNESKIFKVRVEMEDYDPAKVWYGRKSLNSLAIKNPDLDPATSDQEVVLLDLRDGSDHMNEVPFKDMDTSSSFTVSTLDFRGNYPWGGNSSSFRFMYSIMLNTARFPSQSRTLRKYIRFSANNTNDLELNGLLDNIGPVKIQRGQFLSVIIHSFEFYWLGTGSIWQNRQMPGFWYNGSLT